MTIAIEKTGTILEEFAGHDIPEFKPTLCERCGAVCSESPCGDCCWNDMNEASCEAALNEY